MVDFEKFSRHRVIGKVSVPLCEVDLLKGGHWWKALVPSSQVRGGLVVSPAGIFAKKKDDYFYFIIEIVFVF